MHIHVCVHMHIHVCVATQQYMQEYECHIHNKTCIVFVSKQPYTTQHQEQLKLCADTHKTAHSHINNNKRAETHTHTNNKTNLQSHLVCTGMYHHSWSHTHLLHLPLLWHHLSMYVLCIVWYMCTFMDSPKHTHTHTSIYTHTHIHIYTPYTTHTHIHTYTHTHIHTYTLTHIHTYTQTHMQTVHTKNSQQ